LANFRRSQRFVFRLDVLLKGAWKGTPTTTEDVSFHGVFVRTDEERATNQLLKFTVTDPRNGEAVELMGIVARCVPPHAATAQRPPGIGVSLFGNDRATEARWVSIIRHVKGWSEQGLKAPPRGPLGGSPLPPSLQQQRTLVGVPRPAAATPTPLPASTRSSQVGATPTLPRPATAIALPPPPSPPPPPRIAPSTTGVRPVPPALAADSTPPPVGAGYDATKRAHVRRPAKFNVTLRPEGVEALQDFELRDISEGGTFVLSPTLIPVGSRVNLRLVHPQSGETFAIEGHVARAVDSLDEREKGIGIRFEMSAEDRAAWRVFVLRFAPQPPQPQVFLPSPESLGGVQVSRTPRLDPPIFLGVDEGQVEGADDLVAPPVLLGQGERQVPVLLGPGLRPPMPPAPPAPPAAPAPPRRPNDPT
jgi:Tfp pilus assembly protein PilZ